MIGSFFNWIGNFWIAPNTDGGVTLGYGMVVIMIWITSSLVRKTFQKTSKP